MTTPEEPAAEPAEEAPEEEDTTEEEEGTIDPVTGEQRRTLSDLEKAPDVDDVGTEADQYGSAEGLGDEDAGPDEEEHDRGEN
jgi:hypothetical protein